MVTCKNCGRTYEGNYCPDCGQKKNHGSLYLKVIVKNFIDKYWDLDAPFFRTVRELFVGPAPMIRRYIRGKRKRYSNPIRYFIVALGLYFVIKNLAGFDSFESFTELIGIKSPSNMAEPARKSLNTYFIEPINFFSGHLNLFMLLFVFLFSGTTRGLFFKSKYTFAEYLTLSFFVLSQYVIFSTGLLFLVKLDPRFYYLNFIFLFFYSIWVLVQFHKGSIIYRLAMSFYNVLIAWIIYLIVGFFISQYLVITWNL